ncbi:hypothetical protein Tco_1176088 [Tanacetum coccineum]
MANLPNNNEVALLRGSTIQHDMWVEEEDPVKGGRGGRSGRNPKMDRRKEEMEAHEQWTAQNRDTSLIKGAAHINLRHLASDSESEQRLRMRLEDELRLS